MNKKVIQAINTCNWLKLSEKRILIGLWSFWSAKKSIYASYRYFASNWGLSYSTVKRGVKQLEKCNIIDIDVRKGSSNLICFSLSGEELVEWLGQKEKPLESQTEKAPINSELTTLQNELGNGQNELTNSQKELGGEVKKSYHNTEDNTEFNKEVNTDFNNEINSSSFDDSPISIGAEHMDIIGNLEYAQTTSNDMNILDQLVKTVGLSNPREIVSQFTATTGKTIVMYDEGYLHTSQRFWILNEPSKIAQQSKFSKEKFMVVNPNFTKEIVSHYE
ncbi:MAG TPA: helix-turn-helix domain-containing protein [Brumimicrobium sp.]|nr:helix-turn-helix domain-containing protein [Brumimicrobium sp.]